MGVMPGSPDEELMRDDPLILLSVRKNLLLGATHYPPTEEVTFSNLASHNAGLPTGQDWLH